jgi:hypothetical protein
MVIALHTKAYEYGHDLTHHQAIGLVNAVVQVATADAKVFLDE